MTYDAERDEAPSYEGEVAEETSGMRPRTVVALGSLAGLLISIATENYVFAIGLICLYVAGMFIRDYLRRRARDRAWNGVADNVMEDEN